MIIKAIVIPTPRRIKKRLRNVGKDEIFLYGLIGAGMVTIGLADTDIKGLPIFGLAYCGVSYRFLKSVDNETLEIILRNYNRPFI